MTFGHNLPREAKGLKNNKFVDHRGNAGDYLGSVELKEKAQFMRLTSRVPSNPGTTLRIISRRITHRARAIPSHGVRMAWVRAKWVCGLPTRSDRSFLVREFVRLLETGQIGRTCHITASGRTDGAGAQALSVMSAMALARHYGLRYVHSPFRSVAHAESAPGDWAARWEHVFNLGLGELQAESCNLRRVGIEEFIADESWWRRPCLLHAGHFVRFTDRKPEALQAIIPVLRTKFRGPPRMHRRPFRFLSVCAHLRRGDVSPDDPETAHRVAPVTELATSIEQVRATAGDLGVPLRIKVFSQGAEGPLSALKSLGCELHLDTSPIACFRDLADADVLLMGRSTFSFTAGLLNEGVKIYDSFARKPMPDWLVKDRPGLVDHQVLRCAIERRLLARLVASREQYCASTLCR